MIPKKTIEDLISKHLLLEKELSSGKVDKKLFAEKSKEYSEKRSSKDTRTSLKVGVKYHANFKYLRE